MDLISPTTIKELLSKYEARPSKGLGQNFLVDKNVLGKIVDSANIKPSDFILEVGPGLGTLTQELASKAKHVLAIEKDKTMIEILKETLKNYKNVEVISGDILKLKIDELIANCKLKIENYKVVANIPYYLTSPLIRKMLETEFPPKDLVLMLQKEVAQRICSLPPNMSLLAVSVQFYAEAKIISTVSKNSFWPAPKVDSAIIKITPHPLSFPRKQEFREFTDLFFQVVKAGFSQPRKQLVNNLSKTLKLSREEIIEWLTKNNINPTQRAETLSVDDWKNLTNNYLL